jgi:putative nucleotidyltransferase with HDIG domain
MPKLTLNDIVQQVDRLPPMPMAVMKLSQLLEQEGIRAEDLAEVIKLDPDLTSQLLRLCNSAYYALSRKITTVKEAVAILGFKVIKSMVYAIMSHKMLDRPVEGYCLEQGALWQNSMTGAVYARQLANKYKYPDPETAFTAAILRDIGKIVLETHVSGAYQEIEDYARENKCDFATAEQLCLGFSHTDVGYHLAEKWQLPEKLISVIRYHHTPSALPPESPKEEHQLLAIVHLADSLCMMMGAGVGGDGLMYAVDFDSLNHLGLEVSPQSVELLLYEALNMQEQIQQLSDSMAKTKQAA